MHALIVTAHPVSGSLTHALASSLAEGIARSGPENTSETADLHGENFDPAFTERDVDISNRKQPATEDILAEQARIDRADALVLVYPVYWWSFPAILKGWIDRVFSNGWAYDASEEIGVVKRLQRLNIHLVAIGGADLKTYARHGYFAAMKTQIDHGIFDYCGARVVSSELLLEADAQDRKIQLDMAHHMGMHLFDPSRKHWRANVA